MSAAARVIAGRYQIERELGQGGMGTVYQGKDTHNGEVVAIKRLKPEVIVSEPDIVERFAREAEALRELNHPNIVTVYDTVQEADSHYIVMAYMPGGSLDDLLEERGRLSVNRALDIALDLADALTRAHRLKIVHRDIKPANVLLAADGTPRLTDFGVAHIASKERVTGTGAAVGTFDYLPPEALNGEPVDTRTDIWAFGVMLYEMLTGERPFSGQTISHTLTNILTRPTPDLEALRPDAPVGLVDLIYRMLEKDRNARIPSVRQVGLELEALIQGRDGTGTGTRPAAALYDHAGAFATPTPSNLARPRHNFPAQTTPFVGREAELTELHRMIDDPKTRLVTILAPGGMGKTRLGLEVAERHLEHFQGGAYFVGLAPLSDPQNIVPTIAEAVGYQLQQDERSPRQQLLDYLREKNLLLLLDNFEHLIEGASIVSDILRAAPAVQIIATSRERLNLSGEVLFNLGGMDFPDWETPEDALEYSAVKLFMQGAARARPGFELLADDLKYVARICRLVRGMPLGIVLAASWVEMLAVEEIASEISQSLDFLETEMRDVPERHRSIRAVFDYSWNLMNDAEREVFARLAVFRGGMTREAAQQVAGANLRVLTALVNKSLLRRDPDSGRYEIHELLRQYAEERLEDAGEAAATRDAHSAYFASFMDQRQGAMYQKAEGKAVAEIEAEIENIRASWHWAVESGNLEPIDRAMHMLSSFYEIRGWSREGQEAYRMLIERLRPLVGEEHPLLARARLRQAWHGMRLGSFEGGTEIAEKAWALFKDDAARPDRFVALDVRIYIAMMRGQYDTACQVGAEYMALAKAAGDPMYEVRSMSQLGYALFLQGSYQEAKALYEQVVPMLEAFGSPGGIAIGLNNLGEICHVLGEDTEAKALFERAFALYKEANNRHGMAFTLNNLGKVAHTLGDFDAAEHYNEQSLELYREVGDRRGAADALNRVGGTASSLGDYAKARASHAESLQVYRAMGDQRGIADSLMLLAMAVMSQGEFDLAVEQVQESLEIRRQLGNPSEIADALQGLAIIAISLGDLQTAQRTNQESLEIIERTSKIEPQVVGRYYMFQGLIELETGNFEAARQCFEIIRPQLETLGLRWALWQCEMGLGFAHLGLGNYDQARRYFYTTLNTLHRVRILDWAALVLTGFARLRAIEGDLDYSAAILSFVLNANIPVHILLSQGQQALEELREKLPPERFQAAWERGKRYELRELTQELLTLYADEAEAT